MELKVWVEGIQRIVCGVTETTTCQDVVFALAHATGKVGRFTLIEKWRNNERLLAPNENPLKILMKWGEYSSDVQFMLQRSDQLNNSNSGGIKSPVSDLKAALATRNAQKHTAANANPDQGIIDDKGHEMMRKQFDSDAIVAARIADHLGIVRGISQSPPNSLDAISARSIPAQHQQMQHSHHKTEPSISSIASNATTVSISSSTNGNQQPHHHPHQAATAQLIASPPHTPVEFNTADVRNSLDRKTSSAMSSVHPHGSAHAHTESIVSNTSSTSSSMMQLQSSLSSSMHQQQHQQLHATVQPAAPSPMQLYAHGPPISSNGALVPPPYRDPPPPRASPSNPALMAAASNSSSFADVLHHRFDAATLNTYVQVKDMAAAATAASTTDTAGNPVDSGSGVIFHNAQYRELIQLIKYQRETLSSQQNDLGKFDAEIVHLEQREREQLQQLDAIAREIGTADQLFRGGQEQLQQLQYVEEENELVHQQEKTLKSEIMLLRSKLANCETELLQYKNKVRLLLDDIQVEQRTAATAVTSATSSAGGMERHFMSEVDRIQAEIDQAVLMAETANQTADHLKVEVAGIESTIAEKKKQVEQLVNEMKEVNLQSLTSVAPSEEILHLLEGECSSRPGSTRRIIGSPRQLENAVPTSKNPHGVWV